MWAKSDHPTSRSGPQILGLKTDGSFSQDCFRLGKRTNISEFLRYSPLWRFFGRKQDRQYTCDVTLRDVLLKFAFVIWQEIRILRAPCYIAICGLSAPTIFFHITPINGRIFGEGKKYSQWKCVLIFSTMFFWSISHPTENSSRYYHKCAHIGLYVNYPSFLSYFNETWIFLIHFR